jgi:hypothetical protein
LESACYYIWLTTQGPIFGLPLPNVRDTTICYSPTQAGLGADQSVPKGDNGQGFAVKPDRNQPLDITSYIYADFGSLYGYKQPYDPYGLVLCVYNCPCIWLSKLQQLIATSTTAVEWNVLSDLMHEVIPLQMLLEYLAKTISYDRNVTVNIEVTIHKDNAACFMLANLPPGQDKVLHSEGPLVPI